MKSLLGLPLGLLISVTVVAQEAPCILKVYANSTLELHSGLEDLYGLERQAGNAYATFTCINPKTLQSHDLSSATLRVKSAGQEQQPVLKTWLDVNRYYLVTSFAYESAEPLTVDFSATEVVDGSKVEFSKEYTFFDR